MNAQRSRGRAPRESNARPMPTDALVLTENPYNAEVATSQLDEAVTPTDGFFKRNHYEYPAIEGTWTVDVDGTTVSLEQIQQHPFRRFESIMECAGNGRTLLYPLPPGTPWNLGAVSNGMWGGTSLRNVLGDTGGALEVVFEGADFGDDGRGFYGRSLPAAEAMREDVLLCWEMNGQPLTREHGGPLRLVVPGAYGMASVKWLNRIYRSDKPYQGYYQVEDYQIHVPGKPSRPIGGLRPRALITRATAQEVRGWAWSGTGPVTEVEVRVGQGSLKAELGEERGPYAWRSFRCALDLGPGKHCLVVLARDAAGNVQPEAPQWNTQGYENNCAQIVTV